MHGAASGRPLSSHGTSALARGWQAELSCHQGLSSESQRLQVLVLDVLKFQSSESKNLKAKEMKKILCKFCWEGSPVMHPVQSLKAEKEHALPGGSPKAGLAAHISCIQCWGNEQLLPLG